MGKEWASRPILSSGKKLTGGKFRPVTPAWQDGKTSYMHSKTVCKIRPFSDTEQSSMDIHQKKLPIYTWVKVFRINPEFRIESQPQNAELRKL